jgi:ADP-heptose:LPS heptosyltransferase
MELFKGAERGLKRAAGWTAAALLRRPGRSGRVEEALAAARRVLLVRVDARVGEALLMTPLCTALKRRTPATEVHLLAHPGMLRVLSGHPDIDRLAAYSTRAVRQLRAERFEVVVDCTNHTAPSTTAAVISRLCAPHGVVIGPRGGGLGALRDVEVPPLPGTRREVLQRGHLLSPLPGVHIEDRLSFRPVRPAAGAVSGLVEAAWRGGHAVVNPGGRLGARRIPPEAFAAAARALMARGRRPVITWGPGEEGLARTVVEGAPGSLLAPPTSIDDLAALMDACRLTVCNNTGPMHLSVAVGAPTLAFFLRIDVERWGHPWPPHRMVDLTPVVEAGGDVSAAVDREVAAFAG